MAKQYTQHIYFIARKYFVEYASYSGADLQACDHLDMFAFSVGRFASAVMQFENQTDVIRLGRALKIAALSSALFSSISGPDAANAYSAITEIVTTWNVSFFTPGKRGCFAGNSIPAAS